ncbi:hypothetical protein ABW16_01890 [Mycolicibacter heraklionensis]|uniref:Uncharacterized protein n=1 Tax=Mycolicibacter heraklionensis TaxID=512402 RepID=A0ABR5FKQ6_9MYCO|nr:hypothetical protein [Mycolicibacter heraklionensis]KLO31603.1 hypothetical protein ABW16_01890 [Mycolicibacter heraklionensis]
MTDDPVEALVDALVAAEPIIRHIKPPDEMRQWVLDALASMDRTLLVGLPEIDVINEGGIAFWWTPAQVYGLPPHVGASDGGVSVGGLPLMSADEAVKLGLAILAAGNHCRGVERRSARERSRLIGRLRADYREILADGGDITPGADSIVMALIDRGWRPAEDAS